MDTKTKDIIYLDYASTTPVDSRVVDTMLPYFTERFGNAASRTHAYGWETDGAVKTARRQVADLLGAKPEELIFTSGATEAINLAIKGIFDTHREKGNHILTVATEHKAVLDTCHYLETLGGAVTYLGVGQDGLVDLQELEQAITPSTILIVVMYANNETGVLQPIREIATIAHARQVLFMTDATQAVGKVPLNVERDGIDLLACSGHKLYGPKGIGALYVRKRFPRIKLSAQVHGGGHERGFRSGTLNTPAIVGFGKACELASLEMQYEADKLTAMREWFELSLSKIPGCRVHAGRVQRLPHIINLYVEGIDAEALIIQLRDRLALSSGSACTSAELLPSHVLMAMYQDEEVAYSSIRISLGRTLSESDLETAFVVLQEAVETIRVNY